MQLTKPVYYLYFLSDHGSSIEQLAPATLWDSMAFPESLFQQQASQLKHKHSGVTFLVFHHGEC